MPCFYTIYGTSPINLSVGNTVYALCVVTPGLEYADSKLACTANSNANPNQITTGTVSFSYYFNVGFGNGDYALQCANRYTTAGTNQITINDGVNTFTAPADFDATGFFGLDPNFMRLTKRVANLQQLGSGCPTEATESGTIGLTSQYVSFDCLTLVFGITNDLNAWYYPKTTSEADLPTILCNSGGASVTYLNLPAGWRPWITISTTAPFDAALIVYTNNYNCVGQPQVPYNLDFTWGTITGPPPSGDGNVIVSSTRTYTGSVTTLTTLPYISGPGQTITIIEEVPIPTTTVTSTWTGSSTRVTVTVTPGETATVSVLEPPLPTITQTWTETFTTTTTQTNSDGVPVTVIVEVPVVTPPTSSRLSIPWNSTVVSTTPTDDSAVTNSQTLIVPTPTGDSTPTDSQTLTVPSAVGESTTSSFQTLTVPTSTGNTVTPGTGSATPGTGSNAVTPGTGSNAVTPGTGSDAVTPGTGSNAVTPGTGSIAATPSTDTNAVTSITIPGVIKSSATPSTLATSAPKPAILSASSQTASVPPTVNTFANNASSLVASFASTLFAIFVAFMV